MRTRLHPHPWWCAQGHLCSASRGGEHRSRLETFDTSSGRFVITRVQTAKGGNRLEVRAVVDLPDDQADARAAAVRIVEQVTRVSA